MGSSPTSGIFKYKFILKNTIDLIKNNEVYSCELFKFYGQYSTAFKFERSFLVTIPIEDTQYKLKEEIIEDIKKISFKEIYSLDTKVSIKVKHAKNGKRVYRIHKISTNFYYWTENEEDVYLYLTQRKNKLIYLIKMEGL